jgi:hypothetical protein
LGDVLELWDPEDWDRDNVIKDSIRPFSQLFDINCEKIYVVGNHDEFLGELDKRIGCQILGNGTIFDIYNRPYPELIFSYFYPAAWWEIFFMERISTTRFLDNCIMGCNNRFFRTQLDSWYCCLLSAVDI